MPAETIIRELTEEERARWGECRICGAAAGELCTYPDGLGIPPHEGGAHAARLIAAPLRVAVRPMQ